MGRRGGQLRDSRAHFRGLSFLGNQRRRRPSRIASQRTRGIRIHKSKKLGRRCNLVKRTIVSILGYAPRGDFGGEYFRARSSKDHENSDLLCSGVNNFFYPVTGTQSNPKEASPPLASPSPQNTIPSEPSAPSIINDNDSNAPNNNHTNNHNNNNNTIKGGENEDKGERGNGRRTKSESKSQAVRNKQKNTQNKEKSGTTRKEENGADKKAEKKCTREKVSNGAGKTPVLKNVPEIFS